MEPRKNRLKSQEIKLIKAVLRMAVKRRVKLYLVGGFLRDMLLGREKENPDIDFCLKRGAISFGREVAKALKCGFVILDKEHGCSRAVKKINEKIYTLDFTDFRGKDLRDDLLHRDFTINALSIEPEKLFLGEKIEKLVFDPYEGRRDLRLNMIRRVYKKAFDEDPLRILRAFSLAAIFGFKIDKETLREAGSKAKKLSGVSFERIREELFKIFKMPDSFFWLRELDKLGVLKVIFPEIEVMRGLKQGPYHHLDVWRHSLETVRQLEGVIIELKNNRSVRDYLDEVISPGRTRRALIKLGALLHDAGKPAAMRREGRKIKFHGHERIGKDIIESIAQRLKLSNDETVSLEKMVLWHLRPGYLADNQEVTPRAIFRYFRDAQKESVSVLLVSLADQRSTKGPLTTRESRAQHETVALGLIKEYFRRQREKKLPRLISGDDLMKRLKLEPSPLIGKILREIEELQAIGRVKTKEEALREAKKLVK